MAFLHELNTTGSVTKQNNSYQLNYPASFAHTYFNSQIDDYASLSRNNFRWQAPVTLELQARFSNTTHNGTWGFGFWNDPFGAGFLAGSQRFLPALPNAAWFFYASPPNFLSFKNDSPPIGLFSSVFCSPNLPILLFSPGLLLTPLMLLSPTRRLLRRLIPVLIKEEFQQLNVNLQETNQFRIEINEQSTNFMINQVSVHQSCCSPNRKMGFLAWIDNQYAGFLPDGKITFGKLNNSNSSCLEISNIEIH